MGLAEGCQQTGCALIGGETAELPEFYAEDEYDLVGTIVGVVEKSHVITGNQIQPGDQLIGLRSLGLHTNGFSLARRILFDTCKYSINDKIPGLGLTVAEELLKNHKSYVKPILDLRRHCTIKGLAHITGGGLPGNLIRILTANCRAEIRKDSWDIPQIFTFLQEAGNVASDEMYRVFNMGIGLVLVVSTEQIERAIEMLTASGEVCYRLGEIVGGEKGVRII